MAAQRRPRARADLTVAGRADNSQLNARELAARLEGHGGAPTLEVPQEPTLNKDELHLFARRGPRSEERHQGPPSVVTVQRVAQGRSALLDDTRDPRARPGIGAQSSKSARARLAATCRKPLIWKT